MNYRHAFHAGNFADVLKHAVLVALLESLVQKKAPLCYVDTHAGAGRYDLGGAEAQKTQEHVAGIAKLLAAPRLPPALHVYMNLVRALNAKAGHADLLEYPGSPLLASLLLRESDRLVLCEVQDAERASLELTFAGDRRVQVMQRDGYAALKALLPPKERRGLVLIDPPFENQSDEFDVVKEALKPAFKRWATGVYAVWYPIKLRQQVNPFHRWLTSCGMSKILVAELLLHPDNSALRLNGCGMAVINAPWKLDTTLNAMMPVLANLLAAGRYGSHSVHWLVHE
ncbi:MAG TPA: 23S rRNA (adenine(2030)-N(6))-methyltransferase RlmJ [Xanthomonadales bacterium]|nr:23S rRNA (adenine(2030)-N(6))-methyltransferase RlmJ [Xanthomonadales bacterium]